MTYATPAPAQETGTVRVSNLNQPSIRHTQRSVLRAVMLHQQRRY